MQRKTPNDDAVRNRAIYWVTRVHSGECAEAELELLNAWLSQSENHREEYRMAEAWLVDMWKSTPASLPEVEAAMHYRRERPHWMLPVAASFILVFLAGVLAYFPWAHESTYQTAKGERQSITLADGSQIELNTDTELDVRYSWRSRKIHLKHGEALVTVVHGDNRPFEVIAGTGLIRDLGTRFNVHRRHDDDVSVVVVEGAVSVSTQSGVSPRVLTAGEQIAYDMAGRLSSKEKVDIRAATAWSEGLFMFRETPLEEVVRQISRYHDLKIEVDDPQLRRYQLRGIFRIDDIEALLVSIEAVIPVDIQKLDNGKIILYRADSSLHTMQN